MANGYWDGSSWRGCLLADLRDLSREIPKPSLSCGPRAFESPARTAYASTLIENPRALYTLGKFTKDLPGFLCAGTMLKSSQECDTIASSLLTKHSHVASPMLKVLFLCETSSVSVNMKFHRKENIYQYHFTQATWASAPLDLLPMRLPGSASATKRDWIT